MVSTIRIRKIEEIQVKGLGEKIKKARKASNKSIEALCAEVGVSRTYWYDLEKGVIKGCLSVENLQAIEKALNTSFDVNL